VDPPQDPESVDEFFASEEEATDEPEDVVVSDNTGEQVDDPFALDGFFTSFGKFGR